LVYFINFIKRIMNLTVLHKLININDTNM